jgi:hypothetical protein
MDGPLYGERTEEHWSPADTHLGCDQGVILLKFVVLLGLPFLSTSCWEDDGLESPPKPGLYLETIR